MKVCFLVKDLRLSGGVGVVIRHATALSTNHGFEVTVALVGESEVWDHYPGLDSIRIAPIAEIADEEFDIAIASWWDTAYHTFSLKAKRHAYFIQSLEDRFYEPDDIERSIAGMTFDLPVAFITEASWIRDTLKALRPECECYYVRNGIDKEMFAGPQEPPTSNDEPLRILVEGHPGVWFKAIDESFAAISAMREPHHVTFISPDADASVSAEVDRLISAIPHSEMARIYEDSDVVLKLSRVEGMFGPPLEGFHMGATCVVTPVTGHEEYVRHNWNGIVTNWDDPTGTARYLDLLARDRRYLHFLRWNALETADAWPTWKQSTQMMALALDTIHTRDEVVEPQLSTQIAADIWGASTQGFRKIRTDRDQNETYRRRYDDVVNSQAYKTGLLLRQIFKRVTGKPPEGGPSVSKKLRSIARSKLRR